MSYLDSDYTVMIT